jgi:hypothetical protein
MKASKSPLNGVHSGRQIKLMRLAWLVFAFTLICLQIASQAAAYHAYQNMQVPPDQTQALNALGLDVETYAAYKFLLGLPIPLLWGSMGLLIFWQKSHDRSALIISALILGLGTASSIPPWQAFASAYPNWLHIVPIVAFVSNVCLYSFFFVFPTGRYEPRWTVWVAVALSLFNILQSYSFVLPPSLLELGKRLEWFFPIFFIATLASLIVAPYYRYKYISTPVEKQQIKWVVFVTEISILIFAVTALTVLFFENSNPEEDISFITVFVQPLGWMLPFAIIPIVIAASILRYKLFEIDLIIRRTLVYSLLSLLLAFIYLGTVTVLQKLFTKQSGQTSPLTIVLSTLAIAALFNPLRRRIQDFIDRRFYRRKYDAEGVLTAFTTQARDEVDKERLSASLVKAIEETLQPERVSVWLKNTQR